MQWKVQKLISDDSSSDHLRSDNSSDYSSDSDTSSSDSLYSVVVRLYSDYSVNSDYSVSSVYNHLDSLYSVVVRGLYILYTELVIVWVVSSVNQQWGAEGPCYVITLPKVTTI